MRNYISDTVISHESLLQINRLRQNDRMNLNLLNSREKRAAIKMKVFEK